MFPWFTIVFTPPLLTFSILLNNGIQTFIEFSTHLGDLGIDLGITCLEQYFGELWEDEIDVRSVHETYVCHGPATFVENELSQNRCISTENYLIWSGWLLGLLHYNFQYCFGSYPSRCHVIFIKTPHLTCPTCGNTIWIGVVNLLHKMWLSIDKHNQLLYCLFVYQEMNVYMISIRRNKTILTIMKLNACI